MTTERQWTSQAIAREEARRKALIDKGICPDSGYTIRRCKQSICDCFEHEKKYGVSQR
jgi:hypothetical protein